MSLGGVITKTPALRALSWCPPEVVVPRSLEAYGVDAQTMDRVVKPLIGASRNATFGGPTRTGRRLALEAFANMVRGGGWESLS